MVEQVMSRKGDNQKPKFEPKTKQPTHHEQAVFTIMKKECLSR